MKFKKNHILDNLLEYESIGGSEAVVNASYPGDLSKGYENRKINIFFIFYVTFLGPGSTTLFCKKLSRDSRCLLLVRSFIAGKFSLNEVFTKRYAG